MDIFDKILSDHEKIRGLIGKLEATGDDADQRCEAYTALKNFLLCHHDAEQETFFAELVQHAEARDDAMHMIEEHGEHKKIIEQMDAIDPRADRWEDKFAELKDDVLHHIDEEEEDVFEVARQVLPKSVAEQLGVRMTQIDGGPA
ncbi:MAG: hemerythrin domain-containing protein [Bauldia litoralis]